MRTSQVPPGVCSRRLSVNQCSGSPVARPADAFSVTGFELRTGGLKEVGHKREQDIWRKLSMHHGFSGCTPRSHEGNYFITELETWASHSPLVLFLLGEYRTLRWVTMKEGFRFLIELPSHSTGSFSHQTYLLCAGPALGPGSEAMNNNTQSLSLVSSHASRGRKKLTSITTWHHHRIYWT